MPPGKIGSMEKEQFESIRNTYSGKKVFLTGHTGFKGSWLLVWLHSLGCEIKGYSIDESILYKKIGGNSLCNSVIADICDRERLKKELLDFEPDFIFHLAAQPLVRLSYELPVETLEVNVIGTANLLNSIRFLKKACSSVFVTTDKVYENNEWIYPYRENERLGGYDPYSASKAASEIVISSYRNSFFNNNKFSEHQKPIASARAGNVIGGGDFSHDRIIPDLVKAFRNNQKLIVRNATSIRPWQHVVEPLGGYLLLGALLSSNPEKFGDAWNFGPDSTENVSVKTLVEMAINIWGKGNVQYLKSENQPHEAGLLKLDISKANQLLNWFPKYNAIKSVQVAIEWYKNDHLGCESRELILKDIKEYLN
jgi:CDP-glucose 4,6-dehydratase